MIVAIVYLSIVVYLMPKAMCFQNETSSFIDNLTLSYIESETDFIFEILRSIAAIILGNMLETSDIFPDIRSESFLELSKQTITNDIEVRTNMTFLFEYQVAVISFFRTAGIHWTPLDLPNEYLRKYLAMEIQVESIALLDMATDLRTLMQMNRIFSNATMYSTEYFLVEHVLDFVESIISRRIIDETLEFIADLALPIWLASVIESVERDPYLKNQFENKKIVAQAYIDSNPTPIILKNDENWFFDEEWMNSHVPVYPIFHKTKSLLEFHTNTFDDNEVRPSWFFRALVEVARETNENADKLNKIFHHFVLYYPVNPFNTMILHEGYEVFDSLRAIIKNVDFRMAKKIEIREEMNARSGLYKQLRRQQPWVNAHRTNTFSWTLRSNEAYDEKISRPLRKIRVPRTYESLAY